MDFSISASAGLGLRRAYTGGHFVFVLDGAPVAGYVKSVDGGFVKGTMVEEAVGPDLTRFKHLAGVEIEPITLEMGMAMSRAMLDWIKASWNRQFVRKTGAIIHADFDLHSQLEQTFQDALVVETGFPTLDASSKEPAYLTVKLHPEQVAIAPGTRTPITGLLSPRQKLWSQSRFRLLIDNLDCSRVNKIDGFAVKQKVKQLHVGSSRLPELEPTGIEIPNLTLTTSLSHAQQFLAWHDAYVVRGDKDTSQERQGIIEILGPDDEPLFGVVLRNIGILSAAIEKSEANADQVKRCKVELYVESMDLEYGPGLV
ncbi:MAG TPA: phage tail protein [Kofleriaceae bacterium]|nr:phage tail protein [Kofleriaceae bacterium]